MSWKPEVQVRGEGDKWQNTTATIVPRYTREGRPFTEVLLRHWDGYEAKHFLTRLWYVVDDSPHARGAQVQAFKMRQGL